MVSIQSQANQHKLLHYFTEYDIYEVEDNTKKLEAKFKELKQTVIKLLIKHRVEVRKVVYELTELPASQVTEHESFFQNHLDVLEKCKEYQSLFSRINPYWNYLSPQLLYHLINVCLSHTEAKEEMISYDIQLSLFRNCTPLKIFCQIDQEHIEPPEDFAKIEVKFKKELSNEATLQHVEDFRQKYAKHYRLRNFALMLMAGKLGSFIVSFLVPQSIVSRLQRNIPLQLFQEFCVAQVEIADYTSKRVVLHSASTVADPRSVSSTVDPVLSAVDPHSMSTVIDPRSVSSAADSHSVSTAIDPRSVSSAADPHSMSTVVDPHSMSSAADPHSVSTAIDPRSVSSAADPHSMSTVVDPHSMSSAADPHSMSTPEHQVFHSSLRTATDVTPPTGMSQDSAIKYRRL